MSSIKDVIMQSYVIRLLTLQYVRIFDLPVVYGHLSLVNGLLEKCRGRLQT
jgi:hypothetical protein